MSTLESDYEHAKKLKALHEANAVGLKLRLVEALDSNDLKQAAEALQAVKAALGDSSTKLSALTYGLDQAKNDLMAANQGIIDAVKTKGAISGISDAISSKLSVKLANVIMIATGVLKGFKNFPDIAKSSAPTGNVNEDLLDAPISDALEDSVAKNTVKLMMKAMQPPGAMSFISKLLKGKTIPYVEDSELEQQLSQLSLREIAAIGERAVSGKIPITKDTVADITKGVKQAAQGTDTEGSLTKDDVFYSNAGNKLRTQAKSDAALASKLKAFSDPASDLAGIAKTNPDMSATPFFKDLPPGIETVGDVFKAFQKSVPQKGAKQAKQEPEILTGEKPAKGKTFDPKSSIRATLQSAMNAGTTDIDELADLIYNDLATHVKK